MSNIKHYQISDWCMELKNVVLLSGRRKEHPAPPATCHSANKGMLNEQNIWIDVVNVWIDEGIERLNSTQSESIDLTLEFMHV